MARIVSIDAIPTAFSAVVWVGLAEVEILEKPAKSSAQPVQDLNATTGRSAFRAQKRRRSRCTPARLVATGTCGLFVPLRGSGIRLSDALLAGTFHHLPVLHARQR